MRASGLIMQDFTYPVKVLCAMELSLANDGDSLLMRCWKGSTRLRPRGRRGRANRHSTRPGFALDDGTVGGEYLRSKFVVNVAAGPFEIGRSIRPLPLAVCILDSGGIGLLHSGRKHPLTPTRPRASAVYSLRYC